MTKDEFKKKRLYLYWWYGSSKRKGQKLYNRMTRRALKQDLKKEVKDNEH